MLRAIASLFHVREKQKERGIDTSEFFLLPYIEEESFVQIYSPTGQLLHTFADMIASPSRVRIRNDGRIAVLAPNISDSNRYSIYLY